MPDSSPWTIPGDWSNSNNSIELIGAGGSAANGLSGTSYGAGGGGGAYAKVVNVTLSGTANFSVGAGGTTAATGTSGNAGADVWIPVLPRLAAVVHPLILGRAHWPRARFWRRLRKRCCCRWRLLAGLTANKFSEQPKMLAVMVRLLRQPVTGQAQAVVRLANAVQVVMVVLALSSAAMAVPVVVVILAEVQAGTVGQNGADKSWH